MAIFQGMQNILTKKSYVTKKQPQLPELKQTPSQHPCLSIELAATLLNTPQREKIMQHWFDRLGLSEENYKHRCQTLLNRFVEFTQHLPETLTSYYSQTGGLVNHALERTDTALTLVRGYFLPDGAESSPLTEPQTLWMYAVFSASILRGIGKIITEFRVDICNPQGQTTQQWQPYNSSMVSLGSHYQYHFLKPQPDVFKQRNTLLLAKQLMPTEGFRWIASNLEVLRVWLALLDEDDRSAGTFGHVISQADAQAIAGNWQQMAITDLAVDPQHHLAGLMDSIEDPTNARDHEDAEGKFLAEITDWIRRQLESGELLINRQHLFSVAGGLLITSDLFRLFVQNYPEYKNLQSMQGALGSGQGLITAGLQKDATFMRLQDGTKVSGVVLGNPHLVLPETFKQVGADGRTQTINASDFAKQGSDFVAVTVPVSAAAHQSISPTGQLVDQTSVSSPTVGRSRFAPFG